MKTYHKSSTFITKPRGHTWMLNPYEDDPKPVYTFAFNEGEYHNGPLCVTCGYGFCEHCHAGPEEDCTGVMKSTTDQLIETLTSGMDH